MATRRSSSSTGKSTPKSTTKARGDATKGAIRDEMERKKDELRRLKSLDNFLLKNHLGISISGDMKPEIKDVVRALKKKREAKGLK